MYAIVLFIGDSSIRKHCRFSQNFRERVGLHPLTVIFAVLVGGQMGGIVGILLAVLTAEG